MMIRTDPTSAVTPSKSQHLLSLLPRSGRSHCLPLPGPVMHDGTAWRGRKRSRSASSEGSSTSSSPDRNAKRWDVASEEGSVLGSPACGQARSGIQHSPRFPSAPGPVGFQPSGVASEQVALEWHHGEWHHGDSPSNLIRNTGVALEAGDHEINNIITSGRAASSPSSLPLTPALTTTSSASSHIDSESFNVAPRATRTIKRQRLAATIKSNESHPSFERSRVEPDRQDVSQWKASGTLSSSVRVWDLASSVASSVATSRRKDVGDTTVHVSAQSDSDNFAGKVGPLEADDTSVPSVMGNEHVDVAGIRNGDEAADTISNNAYVTSNAFLHDLHLQRCARRHPSSVRRDLEKYENNRSMDSSIMPLSPSTSSASTSLHHLSTAPDHRDTSSLLIASDVYDIIGNDIAHIPSLSAAADPFLFSKRCQEEDGYRSTRYPILGSPSRTFCALSPASSSSSSSENNGGGGNLAREGVAARSSSSPLNDSSIYEDMNRLLGSLVIQRHGRRR